MKLNEDNLVSSGALPKYEADINTEKYYYKTIFESKFTNRLNILPYYWMPKYTNAIDTSARTLQFYT